MTCPWLKRESVTKIGWQVLNALKAGLALHVLCHGVENVFISPTHPEKGRVGICSSAMRSFGTPNTSLLPCPTNLHKTSIPKSDLELNRKTSYCPLCASRAGRDPWMGV